VLVTGFDILFFWVARMMMMGIHFMQAVPFRDVYVHALVRDEEGKKMSKSKGNVIDPLVIIDRYGTDAFRFTLAAFAAQGRDIKMSEKRVDGYRHFINKLWNAARFALMHLDRGHAELNLQNLSLPNQWILSRLQRVTTEVAAALDSYRFNDAAGLLYNFVWHEFCDWYLEAIKPALYDKEGPHVKDTTQRVLWRVLHDTLILLHPFIPFVTEEIWHHMPVTDGSIMKAQYPMDAVDAESIKQAPAAEIKMALLMDVIAGIRNIRGEMNLPPALALEVLIQSTGVDTRNSLAEQRDLIIHLARLGSLTVRNSGARPKSSATAVVKEASIFVSLEGIIDFAKETERLQKEINKLAAELTTVSRKLENQSFLDKAPADVITKVKAKHRLLLEKQQKLQANLDRIKAVEA
jgi:valyl-tRNA synthetase